MAGGEWKEITQVRLKKEQLPVTTDLPGAKIQAADWGDIAVAYARFDKGVDATPLLKGMPGDRCPCSHWGYVLEGSVHVRHKNGEEETTQAGEMFHWPPGHTVWFDQDTAILEFTPKREFHTVWDHINQMAGAARPV
jgi:hypothetical protein